MEVTIFGPFSGDSGWAQHARQFSAALGALQEVDVVDVVDWDASGPSRTVKPRRPSDVGIGIGPMERMVEITGKLRVGFAVWETTVVPQRKLRALQSLDEVWVPSTWGREMLLANGLPADRVHVVPEGVDTTLFRPEGSSTPSASGPFRFLCVGKWETRKGIEDLARAYGREFDPSEPVELVLHCFSPRLGLRGIEDAVRELALPQHAPIRASNPMSPAALVERYNSCDAFVLPTRAEGWGLPILEAMACGLPVIATDYSAHTDFLNRDNGYLIDVAEMIPVDDDRAYAFGSPLGLWAQPDLGHLQRLMRRVYEDRAGRAQKGRRARRDAVARWTWEHSALAAQRRLELR